MTVYERFERIWTVFFETENWKEVLSHLKESAFGHNCMSEKDVPLKSDFVLGVEVDATVISKNVGPVF
jgi:hypothetical protein